MLKMYLMILICKEVYQSRCFFSPNEKTQLVSNTGLGRSSDPVCNRGQGKVKCFPWADLWQGPARANLQGDLHPHVLPPKGVECLVRERWTSNSAPEKMSERVSESPEKWTGGGGGEEERPPAFTGSYELHWRALQAADDQQGYFVWRDSRNTRMKTLCTVSARCYSLQEKH